MKAGPEFGAEEGKWFIVVRALYGLKSAAAAFRAFMAEKLDNAGFKSSMADPDVWMRPARKPDGEEHYEYILMYVDDMLSISINAKQNLVDLQTGTVKYKKGKIEEPETHLGLKLAKKEIDERSCWTITSVDYINAALKTLEQGLEGRIWKIKNKATTPMQSSHAPELDDTKELEGYDINFYQEIIGILRWATELGRVDILHEVSVMSQYQASPREGHVQQLMHTLGYLKRKPKLSLYMDWGLPNINYEDFKTNKEDFKECYRDAEEIMPHRMPEPRGRPVTTTAYVDASFGSNKKTRRSHTGFIIFVNRAPIKWYSKKQPTIESSAFSAEYIALKTCVEEIEYVRFKLRMFRVPLIEEKGDVDHATNVYCDDEAVVKNNTNVESTLSKKHSSCAYNFTRWQVAAGVVTIAWVPTKDNLSDPFTKRLAENKRDYLFGNWTY